MFPGVDLPLSRLRQVDGMDWRLMLCFIYDYLHVYSSDHIPWILRLNKVAKMVCKYFSPNFIMELDNLGRI